MKYTYAFYCARQKIVECSTKPNQYATKIGLEIHARISSKTKIFSDANLTKIHGTLSNSKVAYFDAALPGTMPSLNKKCVEAALLTAHYLNCKINLVSLFERKHYFYPDLPNGYQITQQRNPIAFDGQLEYPVRDKQNIIMKKAQINRIQLEHDSGRTLAFGENSLIDLNRCGIGLMEIVTQPDFTSAKETSSFVIELASILKSIDACDVDMQEGGFRVDVNVSLHDLDSFGKLLPSPRVEIKNLNTFKSIEDAISCEVHRQRDLKQKRIQIKQETRHFDVELNKTILLREKEDFHDYRFMPEPNLPPIIVKTTVPNERLVVNDTKLYESILRKIPNQMIIDFDSLKLNVVLPQERRDKLAKNLFVSDYDAFILVNNNLDYILNDLLTLNKGLIEINSQNVSFYTKILLNEYQTAINLDESNRNIISLEKLNDYCNLIRTNRISKRIGKTVFNLMLIKENYNKTPSELVTENNLFLITDKETIDKSIQKVFSAHLDLIETYKNKIKKRSSVFNFMFTGIQKDLNERADNSVLDECLRDALKRLIK